MTGTATDVPSCWMILYASEAEAWAALAEAATYRPNHWWCSGGFGPSLQIPAVARLGT
jgi:hypothetical protein